MGDIMSRGRRPADNRAAIVWTAVAGRVAPARLHPEVLAVDRQGRHVVLPGAGGISLGVHAGDPVDAWLADHLMVGLSIEDEGDAPAAPGPLHRLSCIGNTVRGGDGRPIGVVAGKRGGLAPGFLPPNLVSVEVPDATADRLRPGDRVVVEALGRGLALTDLPEVALLNMSPRLLDSLPLHARAKGIAVEVRLVVPARLAGSGLGTDAWVGDLEMTSADGTRGAAGELCFGDLVAFEAVDARYGRYYRPGHVAIGLVAHGPSPVPGHGIGITVLLSGPAAIVELVLEDTAGVGQQLRGWADTDLSWR